MAASKLPIPGSNLGPCDGECNHLDCACSRRTAGSVCRFCGFRIGYEAYFYADPEDERNRFVHARCLEKASGR